MMKPTQETQAKMKRIGTPNFGGFGQALDAAPAHETMKDRAQRQIAENERRIEQHLEEMMYILQGGGYG